MIGYDEVKLRLGGIRHLLQGWLFPQLEEDIGVLRQAGGDAAGHGREVQGEKRNRACQLAPQGRARREQRLDAGVRKGGLPPLARSSRHSGRANPQAGLNRGRDNMREVCRGGAPDGGAVPATRREAAKSRCFPVHSRPAGVKNLAVARPGHSPAQIGPFSGLRWPHTTRFCNYLLWHTGELCASIFRDSIFRDNVRQGATKGKPLRGVLSSRF